MVKAAVLKAERALLYVIAFDFKVAFEFITTALYSEHAEHCCRLERAQLQPSALSRLDSDWETEKH